ncbi:MAG: Gfo/Idh/MocA family oxidoreductase, partial [Chitinophagaceae bacterium]|nr:Gfo/Idh/MocA family oxidoreductase [Chitinophagaceae bacterium]
MPSRRKFIKSATLATAGVAVAGSWSASAKSYSRIMGSNRKITLACIGIGNRGGEILNEFNKTGLANIVALCDIDMGAPHTQKNMETFSSAKRFQDFREMLDKAGNEIEAVSVGVPDFSH